uniref:Uncharacterized protein n=1 Tax=Oryza rufipogon TaxID=4529 RepID=A0A0E0N158_ORYRU
MAACGCGHHAEIDSTTPPSSRCRRASAMAARGCGRRGRRRRGPHRSPVRMPRRRRHSPLRSGRGPANKRREAGGAAPPPRTSDKKPVVWRPHPKPPTTMRPSGAESSTPPLPIQVALRVAALKAAHPAPDELPRLMTLQFLAGQLSPVMTKLSSCLVGVAPPYDGDEATDSPVNYDLSSCEHILSLKMCVLDAIHGFYIWALAVLPSATIGRHGGHCCGPLESASNIILVTVCTSRPTTTYTCASSGSVRARRGRRWGRRQRAHGEREDAAREQAGAPSPPESTSTAPGPASTSAATAAAPNPAPPPPPCPPPRRPAPAPPPRPTPRRPPARGRFAGGGDAAPSVPFLTGRCPRLLARHSRCRLLLCRLVPSRRPACPREEKRREE